MNKSAIVSRGLIGAILLLVVGSGLLALAAQRASDSIAAADGPIRITPINHGSVQLEHGGKVIHVDPWSRGDYTGASQADLVLVTDIHQDHLDPEKIAPLRKPGAPVVCPSAAAEKIPEPTVMANGELKTVAGFAIEAVPMYNLQRGPSPGQLFHTKGRGNGYVITLGGKRVYFSGDTECIPEIRNLKGIDVAFMCMNLPYTMPPQEAAECVKAFAPKIVYPYHYRGSDLQQFVGALKDKPEIEVRIRDWYAAPPSGSR